MMAQSQKKNKVLENTFSDFELVIFNFELEGFLTGFLVSFVFYNIYSIGSRGH